MKKELIGRKVRGFYFDDGKYYGLDYLPSMHNYIGKIGVIKEYYDENSYEVDFGTQTWTYPAELIEQHLISDNPLDNLPMISEGVLCEVWDNEDEPFKMFVCARTPIGYVAWASAEKEGFDLYPSYWKNARPIEPVKQYTKEQLEEMVGHKFELI
jgi:hypothetical protein